MFVTRQMVRASQRAQRIACRPRAYTTAAAAEGKEKLTVFDTTLRDGEQSPGATLHFHEKLQIAKQLSLMNVDVCEAGFPIASTGDFEAVSAIAKEVGPSTKNREKPMVICGLSRATQKDIQRCFDAVKHAPLHRIHTFLATSDIHLKYKLKISRDECIRNAVAAVEFAASLTKDVEFSPEDAGRSDPDFLVEILTEIIKAGATTLNIPDTVGYTLPHEYGGLFAYLIANTPGSDTVTWSTHCHNDLGVATANTLSAVAQGARQIEVTVNGIGERAGNTALEEAVMAINTRPHHFPVYTGIDTSRIARASHMVSSYTGLSVQANKAIVGVNAFAHEAGIHQDGVLKHKETYEIMTPESIGLATNNLVLGKHSGKHAFAERLATLGFDVSDEELNAFVKKFKDLADEKKTVSDADMIAIVTDDQYKISREHWSLDSLHVSCGNKLRPTATVMLKTDDTQVTQASVGHGPVDAVFVAVNEATKMEPELLEYTVNSVTDGTEALGEVLVRLRPEANHGDDSKLRKNPQTGKAVERQYVGRGHDVDIIVASAKAYVSAINNIISDQSEK